MKVHQGPNPLEVQNVFVSVADRYDRANDAMTFGLAHLWRQNLVEWSEAKPGDYVLDCATGTGDLAIAFKKAVGSTGRVLGTDFCKEMLDKAPPKAEEQELEIQFEWADATDLKYESNTFDIASIAYGIRNVSDPIKAMSEMARVVKPGGYVMILETGSPKNGMLKKAYQFYFQKVIPRIGGFVTGKRFAYEYLNNSSLEFPSREDFLELMRSTHAFSEFGYQVLMGGGSFMYRGKVK